MGSFTPCGVACFVTPSSWGILTSVLIIASPTLLIALSSIFIIYRLDDRHQFGRLAYGARGCFRLFPHVRNLDALQHGFYALIHLAEGLADVATVALAALPANRDTGGNKQRSVDGLDHFKRRNRMGCARQPVPTVGAVMRVQQTSFGQSLQYLRQRLRRDAEGVGNILRAGAARTYLGMIGQVFHGHERVIGLLG